MNNLLSLLLAAGDVAEETTEVWELVTEYVVYAVIIVISIVLLIVIRKRTRLPRHTELKKKLSALLNETESLAASDEKRMDFIKRVTRVMYKADNLSYVASLLSEKERYADLGRISSLIGEARSALAPYKLGKKEVVEPDGFTLAIQKLTAAMSVLDGVIERDSELKRR